MLGKMRDARDSDGPRLIALIGGVFDEYPGCILDVDGEMPELLAIASWFAARGGEFWVDEVDGAVVACGGYTPASAPGGLELRKLYTRADQRGRGLGSSIVARVEAAARAKGCAYVDLWSDTRFLTAHRLYERLGYVRGPETRDLHDKSASVEYYFRKAL
jgi:putative acetyltransferase